MYSSSYSSHAARHLGLRHQDTYVRYNSYPQLADCYEKKDQLIEKVHTTFPWCQVDKVRNVYAAHMYGMYLLRKEEIQQQTGVGAKCEMTLFHVTTEQRAVQSLQDGLDWRRTKRSRFGRGVSFSDDADYADYFADNKTGEVKRVIMVCTVLVTKTSKIVKPNSGYGLSIPPGAADTTMSPNGRVYVKYNDYEFYPLYFVYYKRRLEDISKSRYFNKNHKNKFNNGELLPATAELQHNDEQLRRQEQQRHNEQLRRQEQQRHNEQLRRQEQQRHNEQLRRQEQQRHDEQLRMQQYNRTVNARQQFTQVENNDGCLIL